LFSILAKERIVAGPGFNRWLIPPAALAIHLSIGMAYGFSVFWLPLEKAYGWPISMLGWMYTLFFVFLGGSAALFGRWVENAGPRKAGMLAACCWGGGLLIAALGVYVHQIWLLWLGAGVIGGIGLGLGYISPVSTLIKWFPDRRGLATGLAIMGFGGGAMVGAPFANLLMNFFATAEDVGVWQTFLALGVIYFVAMTLGAFGYRLPSSSQPPAGSGQPKSLGADGRLLAAVQRTPQFWLAWAVLCLNVSAGIGVLGMASPMIQEIFGGRLIGIDAPLAGLTTEQLDRVKAIGAGFAALLSLFNIVGRIFWASFSDWAGRKFTYAIFFLAGGVLYALTPWAGQAQNLALFVAAWCVIFSMYGGGFAAIPAYLSDLFGSAQISAIHGRLLTAWSVAGILGPAIVNYLRDWQLARGLPASQAYDTTMYLLAGSLALGFACNMLIRPVSAEFFEKVEPANTTASPTGSTMASTPASNWGVVVLAWSAVGVPLLWGVWNTLTTATAFFD
jgi:MFS family permease